jgi:hypothetical protein
MERWVFFSREQGYMEMERIISNRDRIKRMEDFSAPDQLKLRKTGYFR